MMVVRDRLVVEEQRVAASAHDRAENGRGEDHIGCPCVGRAQLTVACAPAAEVHYGGRQVRHRAAQENCKVEAEGDRPVFSAGGSQRIGPPWSEKRASPRTLQFSSRAAGAPVVATRWPVLEPAVPPTKPAVTRALIHLMMP
jgi:hypothetical protein